MVGARQTKCKGCCESISQTPRVDTFSKAKLKLKVANLNGQPERGVVCLAERFAKRDKKTVRDDAKGYRLQIVPLKPPETRDLFVLLRISAAVSRRSLADLSLGKQAEVHLVQAQTHRNVQLNWLK